MDEEILFNWLYSDLDEIIDSAKDIMEVSLNDRTIPSQICIDIAGSGTNDP